MYSVKQRKKERESKIQKNEKKIVSTKKTRIILSITDPPS